MSTLKVNAIQNTSGVNLTRILQVVQSVKTDTVSGTVASGAITGFDSTFNGTITPSSTSSLIYITGFVNVAVSGQVSNVSIVYRRNSSNLDTAVNGNGTTTPIGDASGSMKRVSASGNNTDPAGNCFTLSLLDKPQSTSAQTYSLALGHGSGSSRTMYINMVNGDTNSSGLQRAASVMILMEIAP
tara:strand:+ start:22 stop:576 length:555 start_codon:yes stop_codon:yes gene_type:complete